MLQELHVRDLGVIADLTVELDEGMTAVTGETGAGKTLLVEALTAALGGRVTPSMVRGGAGEALVEARFVGLGARGRTADGTGADGIDGAANGENAEEGADEDAGDDHVAEAGEDAGDEVVLARSIPSEGRSRAFLDGRMATAAALAERGSGLVDVHGQFERHSLLGTAGQRRALDAFAGVDDAEVRRLRRSLARLRRELEDLGGSGDERARRVDWLRYQLEEIEQARIEDDEEDERLRREAERLGEASAHREAAGRALAALEGGERGDGGAWGSGPAGAVGALGEALAALSGRDAFEEWRNRLGGLGAELDEVASELRAAVETWEEDPERLAEVLERRRLLQDLRRKHGGTPGGTHGGTPGGTHGGTLADVLEAAGRFRVELSRLESAEEGRGRLRAEQERVSDELERAESELRDARQRAGRALSEAVTHRLHELAMPGASFHVEVGEVGAGDEVRFLLAANPGEPARPLAEVASGGELARTTLALRLVSEGGPHTLLFDEVDAGVGGEAALALARALAEVARRHQVLVVTHLPQVAARADRQLAVRKVVEGGRTRTDVEPLSGERRVVELARMLSGHPDSAVARAHAEDLLRDAERGRSGPGLPTAGREQERSTGRRAPRSTAARGPTR